MNRDSMDDYSICQTSTLVWNLNNLWGLFYDELYPISGIEQGVVSHFLQLGLSSKNIGYLTDFFIIKKCYKNTMKTWKACLEHQTQFSLKALKKPSGFSLIEVLITLMLLSFGIMGTGKLLVQSTAGYSLVQKQAEVIMMMSTVVETLGVDSSGLSAQQTKQYLQDKLDNVLPGSTLIINYQKLKDKCVYTITLSFALARLKTVVLEVIV